MLSLTEMTLLKWLSASALNTVSFKFFYWVWFEPSLWIGLDEKKKEKLVGVITAHLKSILPKIDEEQE